MLTRENTFISEAEYLRLEDRGQVRHEYVNGEMFAMTGGTLRHNVIAVNLLTALRAHLHGTPCRAFIADVRVRVKKHNAYYYPDLVASCGTSAQNLDSGVQTLEDPILIVEVLSIGTEATDRREKLLAYRTIGSLNEYVLVSQDEPRVEIHRRKRELAWELVEYSGLETVEFSSVSLRLEMREIYEGVPIELLARGPDVP